MKVNLDNLPRTISLLRADESYPNIPNGFPVLVILDQTLLPCEESYRFTTDWREVIEDIKRLRVRGAPAIGIAGAAAVALRAAEFVYAQEDAMRTDAVDFDRVFVIDENTFDPELYKMSMGYSAEMITATRPTAVNLKQAVKQCMRLVEDELDAKSSPKLIADKLFDLVNKMIDDDERSCRAIGFNGASLLPCEATVLTHCNAGSLATAFYGTALGIVYTAAEKGKLKEVFADETRPVNQGARLTAWELSRAGIPVTLICDDMAASIMAEDRIDAVIVGADRIAANGDVANKIGTLNLAILAHHFGIPLYVAAPTSTIDAMAKSGESIPIEQRNPEEILASPIESVQVMNPAFDMTPAALVTKIITERGIFDPADVLMSLEGDEH